MRRRHAVLVASPLLLLAACSSHSAGTTAAPATAQPKADTTAPATTGAVVLTVSGYHFPALTVAPGARISLVDGDDEPHTVTATDGSFNSGPFDKTAAGSLTAPSRPGTYAFTCTIHPSMHGTLVVR